MVNIDLENEPLIENETEKGLKYKRTEQEWFYYYGHLYIRYIACYRFLEDAYDQMLHP